MYEQILNGTALAVVRTDDIGTITMLSEGASLMMGYTAEELEGKQNILLFHDTTELDNRAWVIAEDTSVVPVGFDILVSEVPRRGNIIREWTYIRKDKTSVPVQLNISQLLSEAGKPDGFLISITDISRMKFVEHEVKNLLNVTKEQNERLLNFAHIVSHNLRSHSGNFSMLLSLFRLEFPDVAASEMVRHLNQASDNLAETISHLTEVVHLNTQAGNGLEPVYLSEAVERSVIGVKQQAEVAGVKIINLVPSVCRVQAIPAYLDSILLNLLGNSIRYRHPDREGEITLSVKKERKHWVLSVADNGLGIDLKRYGSKLFGMYKTFHGNTDARGVGLFITRNQVQAMNGEIWVESTPDIGTTFKIRFI
jgi:signal transduction histidine kinase